LILTKVLTTVIPNVESVKPRFSYFAFLASFKLNYKKFLISVYLIDISRLTLYGYFLNLIDW